MALKIELSNKESFPLPFNSVEVVDPMWVISGANVYYIKAPIHFDHWGVMTCSGWIRWKDGVLEQDYNHECVFNPPSIGFSTIENLITWTQGDGYTIPLVAEWIKHTDPQQFVINQLPI